MKRLWTMGVALGIGVGAIAGTSPARAADRRAGIARVTLAQAIEIAVRQVPGEALRAAIEVEDGRAVIEVIVHARERRVEVEVDGETGRILEVEDEDGEGGDEDDG